MKLQLLAAIVLLNVAAVQADPVRAGSAGVTPSSAGAVGPSSVGTTPSSAGALSTYSQARTSSVGNAAQRAAELRARNYSSDYYYGYGRYGYYGNQYTGDYNGQPYQPSVDPHGSDLMDSQEPEGGEVPGYDEPRLEQP